MKNKIKQLIAIIIALWVVPANAAHWQAPAYLMHAFNEVALKNEYRKGGATVRKWQQPINVWVHNHAIEPARSERLLLMHLDHLQAITGHEINLVNTAKEANVNVIFTMEKHWSRDLAKLAGTAAATRHANSAVCMAGISTNKQHALKSAWALIPVDRAVRHRKLVTCIVEEVTQLMGLPNDSEHVYPSIFNDKTPNGLLTGLDGLLLKMLYLPTVKSGMTATDLKPIFRETLGHWQQDGTIDNANQTIRNGALYPLMGY